MGKYNIDTLSHRMQCSGERFVGWKINTGLPWHRKAGNLDIHFSRQWKHGICRKYLKYVFTQGIYLQHRENFEIKGCTRVAVGCSYNLLAVEAIFEFGDNTIMEWSYCKRLYCICDCSLELISSSMSLSAGGGRGINGNTHFCSTKGGIWPDDLFIN